MNKGDLIGYVNLDGDLEWGIVVSDEPFMYRPSASEGAYMAVKVKWPSDPSGASDTHECVDTILSDDAIDSGIWLQSSNPAR
tara:strand:+ start:92 stop:337 length:246 start_codon:yes stop_codon:yes gene_type:complete